MNSYIVLEHVSKTIKNRVIIDDVSLTIDKGQVVGFVGRNGSGKTVLLKLICGIYTATNGSIVLNGRKIGKEIDFPDDVGMIIETPGFLPGLSGFRNLKLLAQINKKADSNAIRDAMKAVDLDPAERKPVGKYSLGMRQRLGLAQAIMEKPEILILDEPFNGMDTKGAREMRSYLSEQKKSGKTILLASHIAEDIDLLCDSVYELDAGRITKVR